MKPAKKIEIWIFKILSKYKLYLSHISKCICIFFKLYLFIIIV